MPEYNQFGVMAGETRTSPGSPTRRRELPFHEAHDRARETRAERVERLLSAIPKIDRASAPQFDYVAASKLARGAR